MLAASREAFRVLVALRENYRRPCSVYRRLEDDNVHRGQ